MTPEISKMLTLSTGHISEDTTAILNHEVDENTISRYTSFSVYEKGEYGYFIYPSKTGFNYSEEELDTLPPDLADIFEFARDLECDILCLDCDGPERRYLNYYNH